MIQLLFAVLSCEMTVIVLMLFKNPLRKLVITGLDRVKRGRGPVMVKTVGGTVLMVMMTSVYSAINIQKKRSFDDAMLNPTHQLLFAKHLLESTLMGASLFLALMIDRLHHYIRELRIRRKSIEAAKKQTRGFEDGKVGASEEVKVLKEEITTLRETTKQLELELVAKTKETKAAELSAIALSKQSEGFLLEYDRILEENQNLRSRLHSLDRKLSYSGSKKNI